MEKFVFTCPLCGNQFYAQEEWIGKTTECPNCRQEICIKKQSNAMPTSHNLQMPNGKNIPSDILMWTILGGMGGGIALGDITFSCCQLLSLTPPRGYWIFLIAMIGASGMGSVMYQIKNRFIIGMTMLAMIISFGFWITMFGHSYINWCISIATGLGIYFLAKKTKYHEADCA